MQELIIATGRALDSPLYDLTLWEIRQMVKSSTQSPVPGGPRELQQRGNYDELRDLCLKDIEDLPRILPADQRADQRLYNRAIFRYMIKYFCVADEEDGNAIWLETFFAQQHRLRLGFPAEYYDKCPFSPVELETKPAFSLDVPSTSWDKEEGERKKLELKKESSKLEHEDKVTNVALQDNSKKVSSIQKSPMEILQSKVNSIAIQIAEQRTMIEECKMMIQAIGEAMASGTSVNNTQRRILSSASLEDLDGKCQWPDTEGALFEISRHHMSEDELEKSW